MLHNYSVMVLILDNGLSPTLIPDVYANDEKEAEQKAIQKAKDSGAKNVLVAKISPNWIVDHGPVPKYNFTMIVNYIINNTRETQIIKNVEADSREEAKRIAWKFIEEQFVGSVITEVSISTERMLW